MFPLPLLAFDLATPAMLGWLAAAAVPLLIHLWSRRRYREMSWAAMEYLLAAIKSSRRRLVLEQWLLLAVRTLLVALVVLALAEPFLSGGPLAFVPGERTHRLIVLDASYSMAYKPGDTSRFDQAKRLAAQLVSQCPQGDGFTLVLMASPASVVVGTPVFEPNDFLQQLDGVSITHTSADLASTLAKVEKVLTDVRHDNPGLHRHEVYFLTDLCRVGWEAKVESRESRVKGEDSERSPLSTLDAQLSARLARLAAVTVLDVGQPGADNAAVTGLRTTAPFVTVAESVDFEAEFKSFAHAARNRQPVELVVDGRRVRQQQIDLPAGGEASAVFSYHFENAGDHTVEVRLAGDQLDVDDHRWLAVPVMEAVQVLCIDGRPSGRPFGGATDYLAAALAPGTDRRSIGSYQRDPVHVQVAPESALLELDLGRYDCVFLADVAQFTSSEARLLDAYVRHGGSVVFFLGPQVLADRYNRELGGGGSSDGGVDLLPARLGAVVDVPQFRLDPLGYRHPIVRDFRDRERAGLLTTPVAKHYKLAVGDKSDAKVALKTGDGDPLIVERPLGRGRVVLVSTSADLSWTSMPVWPSYVPVVQELLAFAVAGELRQRNLEVGRTLAGPLADTLLPDAASLAIELPDGRSQSPRVSTQEGETTWTCDDTTTSGIYTFQAGPPSPETKTYAVNLDTVESDLARVTPEELHEEIWPDVPFTYRSASQEADGGESSVEPWSTPAGPLDEDIRGGGLAKALLYAVLALLFVETFLARRFGYHGP